MRRPVPVSAADVVPVLFRRELDLQQRYFAMGEAIAHLNHLWRAGRITARCRAPTAPSVSPPHAPEKNFQRGKATICPLPPGKRPPTRPPAQPRKTYDPVAFAQSLVAAADKSAELIGDLRASQAKGDATSLVADELGIGKAFMEMASKMLANPYKLAETQLNLWADYMNLWQASTMKLMGAATRSRRRAKQERQALSS